MQHYLSTVDNAQWSFQGYIASVRAAGQATSTFSAIVGKVKGVLKNVATGLLNAAVWFAVEKGIEFAIWGVKELINLVNPSEKRIKEVVQNASDALDSAKAKLSDTKEELEDINDKIDTLLSKDSLTFVEEQELQNLRDQKALLEDTIRLQREASEDKKQDYLDSGETL